MLIPNLQLVFNIDLVKMEIKSIYRSDMIKIDKKMILNIFYAKFEFEFKVISIFKFLVINGKN